MSQTQTMPENAVPEEQDWNLEKAFASLDRLIGIIQDRDITLEEAFKAYEEGMRLLKQCGERIDLIEKKVIQLSGEGEEIGFS